MTDGDDDDDDKNNDDDIRNKNRKQLLVGDTDDVSFYSRALSWWRQLLFRPERSTGVETDTYQQHCWILLAEY